MSHTTGVSGEMGAAEETAPLKTWQRRLATAKKEHRPGLKNWTRDGFGLADKRAQDFEAVAHADYEAQNGLPESPIDRIHCDQLSLDKFWDEYERPELPVILQGIPESENWAALNNWSLDQLQHDYRDVRLKCGEDDDGYSVKVKVRYFMQYCLNQKDDSPLYVFDSHFDEHSVAKSLLKDYTVPIYFRDDLFSLVGEKRRPPYRWFLIGPKRSGTCSHIDPLGTSAWNTVLVGRKRWVLFSPETPRNVAKGNTVILGREDDEPVNFFVDHVPRLRKLAHSTGSPKMYEFVQYPGETVFIPGGWWHAVLNLDDTVAVTQNFCSRVNFDKVWRKTRVGRKKMAVKWLKCLARDRPELAERAAMLNARDHFEMPASDRSNRKHHKKKKKHIL